MAKSFLCTRDEPVVQTKAGKLRGYLLNGTYTFHGIKYADAKRFQAPTEVEPWEGIKDALSYGFVCPLMQQDTPNGEILVPHRYWPMDENCQYLNVWTQSLDAGAKKPVMVWLHGGGFAAGSSIEQAAYEGENMSKYGDVVVVSLNHRLNILGYMNLESFGEKYANSGNAGNADMVAALQWIHDNIASFGGDPENVTIFGQSGGGMKVWCLMQTPSADGLFHKGVVQSGVIDGFTDSPSTDGTKIVNAMLKELGFAQGDAEKLETVPYAQMVEAYMKVARPLAEQGEYIGGNPIPNDFYVGDPLEVGFTEHAKTIPVMVGTAFGEFNFARSVDKHNMTQEQIQALIAEKFGAANAQELIALFVKTYPNKDLADLLDVDSLFRAPSKKFIAAKAEHPQSPTYSYLFAYEFPYDNGKPAWHCSEIPYVFHNAEKVPVCNKVGVSDQLEEQVFGAWVNFARTGSPNHALLPQWPACKPGDEATMIFDEKCEVRHNHDNDLMALHVKVAPNPFEQDQPAQH
ncbi:MAG: carboxylesterase family protein [Eubacteriales bacterium]|nr:carboxylesterase family protein [Eubacteriales bacterium]